MGGVRVLAGTRKGAFVLTADGRRPEDISHGPVDVPLPRVIADGVEPFIVLGALSGG